MTAQFEADEQSAERKRLLTRAFALLASAELERWPDWSGPSEPSALQARIEALAVLLDIVPRLELARLDEVISAWSREFECGKTASAAELRATARRTLKLLPDEAAQSFDSQEQFSRAGALLGLPIPELPTTAQSHEPQAQRQCAFGLGVWLERVKKDEWTRIPAVIPGDRPVELEKAYVELYAIQADAADEGVAELTKFQRTPGHSIASQYPSITAASMAARTLERCVVVGEPGSGKSTLMRWLVWSTNRAKLPDFDVALLVQLSAFAAELDERPSLSVLEFFFESLNTRFDDWRDAANCMRHVAGQSRRFLLLLDGWDEVPGPLRENVRRRLAEEEPYFVTVITSRPSGLPHQLLTGSRVAMYRVARLPDRLQEDFIGKLLRTYGKSHFLDSILRRIREEDDFAQMAGNPFLLGLLVSALARKTSGSSPLRTRSDLYAEVVAGIKEQYNQSANEKDRLTAAHFAGMRGLSHGLLFDGERPRYLFTEGELSDRLRDISTEPALRSRFINRIDAHGHEHGFVHATFQEYFAAEYAATFSDDQSDAFMNRAFRSASRLIVLEFVAGMTGRLCERCRQQAIQWLRERDRYLQSTVRLARLIAAGRWPDDIASGIGPSVRDQLWHAVVTNDDMDLVELAVNAFAAMDAVELCRRARKQKTLSTWAIECMTNAVPRSVARREALDELLTGEWETFAGFDVRGGATPVEVAAIRAALADSALSDEDQREAAIRAGAARDRESVPGLLGILYRPSATRETLEQVIFSLGLIGGRQATDALVRLVLGEPAMTEELLMIAAAGLRNVGDGRRALDPVGRDRLLRRVAALPPDTPKLKFVFASLEGFPVRDGAKVIAEIAMKRDLAPDLRAEAIGALATATEQPLVQEVVSTIASEPSSHVATCMLRMAINRSLGVSLDWIEEKIKRCRDRVTLHQLVKALVLLLPNATTAERRAATRFLHGMIAATMKANAPTEDDRAKALVQALATVESDERPYLSEETFDLAQYVLSRFAESPGNVADGCALLAAATLEHFRRRASRPILRRALDAALRGSSDGRLMPQSSERVATALARSLCAVAPEELLHFPPDCAPVDSALRSRAVRRGWLIFHDRILDGEGTEIARWSRPDVDAAVGPAEYPELTMKLTAAARRDFQAYCLMVGDIGPSQPTEPLHAIHAAMVACWKTKAEDSPFESLVKLYPKGPPKFETWKKSLNRSASRLNKQPGVELPLRLLGLLGRRDST